MRGSIQAEEAGPPSKQRNLADRGSRTSQKYGPGAERESRSF